LPASIIGVGARVYFVGTLQGAAPPYKLPIAWLDVPSDPRATTLPARTVLQSFGEASIAQTFAGPNGALFLVNGNATKFFPGALVVPPLDDLATVGLFPSAGIANGAGPVSASGSRLVLYRWSNDSGVFNTSFSFETGAGTGNAQSTAETAVTAAIGPTYSQPTFAQGADGSVVWTTPTAVLVDGGDAQIKSARVAWIVADASATTFDATAHVDIETYAPPLTWGTSVAGPLAVLDNATALVLAAAPGVQGQTSVQVAKKSPPSLVPNKRYVVPVGVTQVGAAASNGFGYVLAADSTESATIHVFAPACSP
jgi:hypothetical protein